jgi:hypothetical protein
MSIYAYIAVNKDRAMPYPFRKKCCPLGEMPQNLSSESCSVIGKLFQNQ